jgi:ankyrin repeat protein
VSAGRAEPIDELSLEYIQTIFFEPVMRTPGSPPKEIVMPDSRSAPVRPRRLPQQPNLEQLKKQAKELLEQFHIHDSTAVAEVRQFERNADPFQFALNDAQRVLARAYGFESWPKLKAFVDGATITRFADAVKAGDTAQVRSILVSRPELVNMDRAGNDEHRGLHYAVLSRNAPMVKLSMEAGADARKGIYPNRDATSALTLARDRGYIDIVAIIEEEERRRREEMSCPNASVSPVQDQISAAILQGNTAAAMRLLEADRSLIQACDRHGATPLHIAAQMADVDLMTWLLERRANVRKQDANDSTALDRAAQSAEPRNDYAQRFPAVAQLLLDHGAEITVSAAVALGDADRVRAMLAADPVSLSRTLRNGGLLTLAVNHNQLGMVGLPTLPFVTDKAQPV